MDIQVDPGIHVVNLENCISSQATQQVVKGECMYTSTQSVMKGECLYTVAVATDETSAMVQIPVSVHCARDVQQSFGTIAQLQPQLVTSTEHQQYGQVESQQYTQIEMAEDLQCLVVDSGEAPSNENLADNGVMEVQPESDQQQHHLRESSDPNASYYTEIFNFLMSKSAPVGATMSYKMMLKTRAKNYRIIDGVLYYWHNKPKKVITEHRDQLDILQKSHVESGTGVHLGVKKMYNSVNNVYFWRGQYVDVANFVRQCNICTEAGETRNTSLMLQKALPENTDEEAVDDPLPEHESRVWRKVEVNLYGPYPKTVGQNEYLVTIVDPVSRWIVAQPVPDVSLPSNVASFVYKTFCLFGFAKCYIGKMLGQLFESICTCYQQCINSMREVLTALGFPSDVPATDSPFTLQDGEGEGQCVWTHHALDTFVSNNPITWDLDLNKFLFEFHITVKEGISSPYFKMFGRKPNNYADEDKENMDALAKRNEVGITYRRRRLQSSILQCRHCEETFTSKISFRIHQRKHTEEARQRGMLEGQEPAKPITEREKRLLNRAVLKRKQRLSKLQGRKRTKPSLAVDHESKNRRLDSPVELNASKIILSTAVSLDDSSTVSEHMLLNQKQFPPDTPKGKMGLVADASDQSTVAVVCTTDCNPLERANSTTELNVIVHSTDSFNDNHNSYQPSQNMPESSENINSSYEPEGPFFCDVCNSSFQFKSSLISHLEKHEGELLRCSKCPYASRSDKLLQYHQNIHKGTFQCRMCDKLFTRRIYLKYHVTNIHRGDRSSHVCEVCGAKFPYLSGLKMHTQLTHEPSKTYPCALCAYVGKCTNSLASHLLRKHKKKFQCKVCEYSSLTEGGLNQHLRIVHSEGERQFACHQCSYRGAKRRQLLEHEKNMHCPDICRHPCPICKKLFKTQVLMKHHLLTHTDQQLYSCKGCNYTTRFRQTLHYHIKHTHPGGDMKDLSIGPSEADFQAIISSATQADQQVVHSSDECTLIIGQDVNEREHGNTPDPTNITQSNELLLASSYLDSTYGPHHIESAHNFVSTNPVSESHQGIISSSELQLETEQAVTIIDGSGLTSEDVHKIVNFTNDLNLRKHEMHQTLTPLNAMNVGDSEAQQIVTFIEGLDSEKTSTSQHVVTLLNSSDVDPDRMDGSQSTVTHINLLDSDIAGHRNVLILPLRDTKVTIFQDDDLPLSQEQQSQDHLILDEHSSLLDLGPQESLAAHEVEGSSWNHVTVYHLDQ